MTDGFVGRPKAHSDIAGIADYIAADDLEAAERFLDEVYQAFELLARMQQMGSARRFWREGLAGIRLWRIPHFEKHLVIYRPHSAGVEIIRVLHGAQNVERLLRL
jgi:toxin ParE1/3/4